MWWSFLAGNSPMYHQCGCSWGTVPATPSSLETMMWTKDGWHKWRKLEKQLMLKVKHHFTYLLNLPNCIYQFLVYKLVFSCLHICFYIPQSYVKVIDVPSTQNICIQLIPNINNTWVPLHIDRMTLFVDVILIHHFEHLSIYLTFILKGG